MRYDSHYLKDNTKWRLAYRTLDGLIVESSEGGIKQVTVYEDEYYRLLPLVEDHFYEVYLSTVSGVEAHYIFDFFYPDTMAKDKAVDAFSIGLSAFNSMIHKEYGFKACIAYRDDIEEPGLSVIDVRIGSDRECKDGIELRKSIAEAVETMKAVTYTKVLTYSKEYRK